MRILVIGGTGFIGHHVVEQLLADGHEPTLLCRTPDKARETFGKAVHYHQGDLSFVRDINFDELFDGIDALIYATGTDERDVPTGDLYAFFYKGNVTTCVSVLENAKAHGVRRAIVLGSIFSFIDREHPELELSRHHAYIRSRTEQRREILALADKAFTVNLIEIPFIFGHTPGFCTLWEALVTYIRVANPLIVTPGGANCMSVKSAAKATVGVLDYGDESCSLPIGDENLTWADLLERISSIANAKDKRILLLQRSLFSDLTRIGSYFYAFIGMRSGLNQKYISGLINHEAFLDTERIKKQLHYEGGDLDEALAETVNDCPKASLVGNLRRSVNWLNDSTSRALKHIDRIMPPRK